MIRQAKSYESSWIEAVAFASSDIRDANLTRFRFGSGRPWFTVKDSGLRVEGETLVKDSGLRVEGDGVLLVKGEGLRVEGDGLSLSLNRLYDLFPPYSITINTILVQ